MELSSKELWLGAVFSMIPAPDQAYPPLGIISCTCCSSGSGWFSGVPEEFSKELWLGAVFSMIPTPDQAYPPLE